MKDPALTRREAAEWFVTIHAAQDPPADLLQRWLSWLEASEENKRAFESVAQIWHSTTPAIIARRAGLADEVEYDGSVPVAEWRARLPAQPSEDGLARRWRAASHVWRRPVLAVTAAAIVAVSVFVAFKDDLVFSGASQGTFATRTGEHMNLLLADGSHVTLGGGSRLTVEFADTRRQVRLDAGEAFFAVHKDPERPFTVLALDGAITAIGTAFNVRTLEDHVTVTVTEGIVRVGQAIASSSDAAPSETESVEQRLARGQQLTYVPDRTLSTLAITSVKRVDPGDYARWRDGWLVYRDESLRYVIADISRYTDTELAVDESAADVQITGAVFKDRIAEWITALPEMSPVVIEHRGERVLIKAPPATRLQH